MSGEGTPQNLKNAPTNDAADIVLSRIEAVLFISQEPISLRRIALLAEVPEGTRIRNMLKKLNARYEKQSSAFRVFEVAGGFQLRTCALMAPWLARLHQFPNEIGLSQPVMETLAIIAWQQPVLRATIEKIRSVQCGEILKHLLEKDLVKIVGKSNDLGHPFLYGTTKKFLHVFGLNRTEELP